MFKKVLITLLGLYSSIALGWGAKGHQIIAYTGGNIATEGQAFWQANLQPLRQLTTVPDRVWKSPSTKPSEAPNHFFQADFYFQPNEYDQIIHYPSNFSDAANKYGEKVVIKNGTAPWRVRQVYQLALQAFKNGDMKSGLQFVGAMSHYIGDISQPLHVSENFDGQQTGNKGIHSYFETTNIKDEMAIRADVEIRAQKLLSDNIFLSQFNGNLMDTLLLEVERSISYKEQILNTDTKFGRTGKGAAMQLEMAKDRMADGAATFAMILTQLWKETGLVANATPMTIQDPSWVKNNFPGAAEPEQMMSPLHQEFLSDDEDCSL